MMKAPSISILATWKDSDDTGYGCSNYMQHSWPVGTIQTASVYPYPSALSSPPQAACCDQVCVPAGPIPDLQPAYIRSSTMDSFH